MITVSKSFYLAHDVSNGGKTKKQKTLILLSIHITPVYHRVSHVAELIHVLAPSFKIPVHAGTPARKPLHETISTTTQPSVPVLTEPDLNCDCVH